MENGSKALLIAGSMLITIIILSLIVMAWNNMRELPKTQEQIKEAEELSAFNKQYESYAKNGIRGSDLVTLVNMANSNNDKYENDLDMEITINFTITQALDQVIRKYELKNSKWNQTSYNYGGSNWVGSYSNKPNGIYKTLGSTKNIDETELIDYFKADTAKNAESTEKYSLNKTQWKNSLAEIEDAAIQQKYYYTKSDIGVEFRRKKFDLLSVDYNNQTGRINYMEFREQ